MQKKTFSARSEAADILMQILKEDGYASAVLDRRVRSYPPSVDLRDQALVTHLVYETISHLYAIDALIDQHASIPVRKMKPMVACTLRVAVQQMCYDDRIPNRAAINEAVRLIGISKYSHLKGFVNAVLRAIDRDGCKLRLPEDPWQVREWKYNLPAWMLKIWASDYGEEEMLRIAELLNTQSAVQLRANTLKTTREALVQELSDQELVCSELLPELMTVRHASGIASWPCITEGRAVVQNESAALAAAACDVRPGMRVLDLCAAPGGKSTYIAQRMMDQGEILSCDLYSWKTELMQKQAARMGITSMTCLVRDATVYEPAWSESFDRVIVDAPCSGWGVVRNKPDIRLHRSEEDLKTLTALERGILMQAARYVKPGGKLIYSTCTLHAAENEHMAAWFLSSHEEYRPGCLEKDLPMIAMCDTIKNHGEQAAHEADAWRVILPEAEGRDGFFIASFVRQPRVRKQEAAS